MKKQLIPYTRRYWSNECGIPHLELATWIRYEAAEVSTQECQPWNLHISNKYWGNYTSILPQPEFARDGKPYYET
jgi:hypothetical protein